MKMDAFFKRGEIIMNTKAMEAVKKKEQGYNCAQAVFCTYCEAFGVSTTLGYQLSEAFGTGIGGLQEVCGSFSAFGMLAGLQNSDGVLGANTTRAETYRKVREAAKQFEATCHHLECREILQMKDAQGERIVPCTQCVKVAALLVEEYLLEQKTKG